jgi:hypothetical protein
MNIDQIPIPIKEAKTYKNLTHENSRFIKILKNSKKINQGNIRTRSVLVGGESLRQIEMTEDFVPSNKKFVHSNHPVS